MSDLPELEDEFALQMASLADPVRVGRFGELEAGDRGRPHRALFEKRQNALEMRAVAGEAFVLGGDLHGWQAFDHGTWYFTFAQPVIGQALFNDQHADVLNLFDFDKDVARLDAADASGSTANAINPDLERFKSRGGKLILFAGWNDPLYSAQPIIDYYKAVIATERREAHHDHDEGTLEETRDFARLFMAPGMGHCLDGPGPNTFGGANNGGGPQDADHDLLSALDRWVENGVAPDKIIATHLNFSTGRFDATRPLCPYPEVMRYKGLGDTTNAANFVCVDDERDGPRDAALVRDFLRASDND